MNCSERELLMRRSSGLCACSMLPGPQTIAGRSAFWNSPASVPKAILVVLLAPDSVLEDVSASSRFKGKCRDVPAETGARHLLCMMARRFSKSRTSPSRFCESGCGNVELNDEKSFKRC
jgi:hypothetical protein